MTGSHAPRIFEIDPDHLGSDQARAGIDAAAEAVGSGGLVIFPTETVYGLASRPDLPEATGRVFDAKRRPRGLSLPVLVPDTTGAWRVAVPTPLARALADRLWPGALTLVLPRTEVSDPWDLGEDAGSVAVRVPDHRLTLALLGRTGPLAATSANRSGLPPLAEAGDLVEAFGADVAVMLVLSPASCSPGGLASTVVDARGDRPVILRTGAVDEGTMLTAAARVPRTGLAGRNG